MWILLTGNSATVWAVFCNTLVYYAFLRPRWKWWLYVVLLVILIFSVPMIMAIGNELFGKSITKLLILPFLGYLEFVLILIFFRDRFCKKVTVDFTIGIFNRLFVLCGYILYIPLNALTGGNIGIQLPTTLTILIMYGVIILIWRLVLRDKFSELIQTQMHYRNWIVLAVIVVFARVIIDLCSNFIFYLNPYSDTKVICTIIALCVFIISVLALYIYNTFTTMKSSELTAAADRLAFEKEVQQKYYETQLHNQEELRRMKHDMNGHLNTISRLIEEDKNKEALSYLVQLGDYAQSHQKQLYSDNPYLNSVISNYAVIFAEKEISFKYEVQHGNLELNYVEMCLVLNNALQNSLEASMKLSPEQRFVRLQVKTKKKRFVFRVTNRFDKKLVIDGKLPRSTKNSAGHGYGLINIRDTAEALGGFVVCKIEGDMFVLDVAM